MCTCTSMFHWKVCASVFTYIPDIHDQVLITPKEEQHRAMSCSCLSNNMRPSKNAPSSSTLVKTPFLVSFFSFFLFPFFFTRATSQPAGSPRCGYLGCQFETATRLRGWRMLKIRDNETRYFRVGKTHNVYCYYYYYGCVIGVSHLLGSK